MLKQVYTLRYKKAIFIIISLLLLFYCYSGFNMLKNWQWNNQYYHSKEFIENYKSDPNNYPRDFNSKGKPILYKNIQDFQNSQLKMFKYDSNFNSTSADTNKNDFDYYYLGKSYTVDSTSPHFLLIFVFLTGFSLFFIDQKTNFNTFLFGLSTSKKDLFLAKIRYVAFPFLGFLGVGPLITLFIYYLGIPTPYLNATFVQMLYSAFSHWILLVFLFFSGIFFGVLLNQLILTILSLALGLFSFFFIQGVYNNLFQILQMYFPRISFYELDGLFVTWPGKTGSPWWVLLFLILCSIGLLFLSQIIFQKISLENNEQFLSVPKFKFPVFFTMTIGSFIWYCLVFNDFSVFLTNDYQLYLSNILLFIVCLCASFGFVYYSELKKYCFRLQQKYIKTFER